MNKALDLLREIRPSIPKEVLELWCKDRDAFLASHPAVEQAGGDERAAFEAYRDRRNALLESEGHKPGSKWHVTNAHYPTWEASRAALAQPSPMRCLACGGYHGNSGLPCPNMRVTAQAQPSPAGVQLSGSRERRIYVAGPMTGYKDFNFPAFNAQAAELRGLGYHVENPAEHGIVDGAEWQDYLRYDIGRLSTCEAIFLLPGWSKSKGAALEVHIAKALGMTFIHHADAEHEQPSPAQAEQHWPKLEKPAQVGGVRFSAGVSSRLVVEAAQRLYEFESTPEKEAERIERLQAFREQCFEPLGTEFSKVLSDNLPELLSTAQAEQAEAERPEVAEVAFVLRNIGAMDAEDIDGDNVDLRFEDAEGRDTGRDVSIVEYAEKAADLFEQHDRIVGALRYKAELYDEVWALVTGKGYMNVTTAISVLESERDAALARVAELEKQESVAWVEVIDRDYGPYKFYGKRLLPKGKHQLYAAPVAQAQHSVPGKYDDVLLPFLKSMEHELHANAGKGDRPGWLQMDRKTALLEIYYHLGKLQKATKGNDTAGIVEYAADVANMSMMLVDVCGLLADAPGKEGV
ncbi:DUF4406 domain-containing protein [Pseudomonas aeruginosa]